MKVKIERAIFRLGKDIRTREDWPGDNISVSFTSDISALLDDHARLKGANEALNEQMQRIIEDRDRMTDAYNKLEDRMRDKVDALREKIADLKAENDDLERAASKRSE